MQTKVEMALMEIQQNPLRAQSWLALSTALYEKGDYISARNVYERASILDPQANFKELILDQLDNSVEAPNKHQINSLLEVKPITVTAGILVKNEERVIHRCITSLIDAVDEIVVIDTGSTDQTKGIVKSFPKVKLVEFEWCDDFSAARNAGFPHMTSEWVLWVDADEYLHPDDVQVVRTVAAMFDTCRDIPILRIGQFNIVNGSVTPNFDQARMYPLRYDLKYRYRVHEQIHPKDNQVHFSKAVRIRLYHDGYEPTILESKHKIQRNLQLLQQMVVEYPDNPTCLLFLGRETLGSGDTDSAINILTKAEHVAKQTDWFGRTLEIYKHLISAYLIKTDFENAEATCLRAIAMQADFPDALYALANIQKEKALQLCIAAEEQALSVRECFEQYRGSVSPDNEILEWKDDLLLAEISLLYGNLPKAKFLYQDVLKKRPNLHSIRNQLDYIEKVRLQLNQAK